MLNDDQNTLSITNCEIQCQKHGIIPLHDLKGTNEKGWSHHT